MPLVRPIRLPLVASTLGAAAGVAIWVGHGLWFSCVGAGSVAEVFGTMAPGALVAFVAALVALVALHAAVARVRRQERRQDLDDLLATARLGLALPVAALLLDPLSFRCTAPTLGLLGLVGVLIHASFLARARGAAGDEPQENGSRKTVMAVALLAMALPLTVVWSWPGASGDEPHYLLLSQSLWKDRDLDLAREYAEQDHQAYWLAPLSPHARPGIETGSRYSTHGVGTAVLVLPAFALAELLGPASVTLLARLLQILAYGAFGVVLYRAAGAVGGRDAGWLAAAVALPLLPLVVYPLAIFPETWAMLAACTAFVSLRAPDRLSRALVGGAALAALPWLGVKLLPLAGALALAASVRSDGCLPRRSRIAAAWGPLLLSLLGHALYTRMLYGSLSPLAVYLGPPGARVGRLTALGADWSAYLHAWPGAVRTLFGHLLDQKDGLLAVAPHYLLAALGVPWMWRRRRADLLTLALVYTAHALPYAVAHELGGQSPPARPLTPVVWAFAILVGVGLSRPLRRWAAVTAGILLASSAWISLRLLLAPELLSHDYSVRQSRLLLSLSSESLRLWRWFPLWVNYREPQWAVTLTWTVLVAALAAALALRGTAVARAPCNGSAERPAGHAAAAFHGHVAAVVTFALLTAGSLAILATVPVLSGHEGGAAVAPGVRAWVPGGYPERAWVEEGNVWVRPGFPREIVLRSDRRLRKLQVALRALVSTDVYLAFGDTRRQLALSPGRRVEITIAGLRGRADGDRWAYRAILGATEGAAPAQLQGGADYRILGANLRILEVEPPVSTGRDDSSNREGSTGRDDSGD